MKDDFGHLLDFLQNLKKLKVRNTHNNFTHSLCRYVHACVEVTVVPHAVRCFHGELLIPLCVVHTTEYLPYMEFCVWIQAVYSILENTLGLSKMSVRSQ